MLEKLRNSLQESGADSLLVSNPANVRYLSGFSNPSDARVIVSADEIFLVTDGRYIAQAKAESKIEYKIFSIDTTLNDFVAKLAGKKLAVEANYMSLSSYKELNEKLGYQALVAEDMIAPLRLIKTEHELEQIRTAAKIADDAFTHILEFVKPGLKEVEVALELEHFMRVNGAEGLAFETIAASGYRSSMPHGTATDKKIESGDILTLDFGANYQGYNSDMTRTIIVGKASEQADKLYHAVLEAQEAALKAVAPGMATKELDGIARSVLANHDLAKYFSHGLGHGVGIDIHEAPRLSSTSSDVLEPNMVITIEPGVYIPGEIGVRIEDLVFVTSDGYETVSQSSKKLIQL